MKKSLIVLALLSAIGAASAQDTNVNSGSTSGSTSGANSGSASTIQSGSATSTAIGNQAQSGAQSGSQSGAQSGSQSGALGNVVNIDQRGPTSQTINGTSTSTNNNTNTSNSTTHLTGGTNSTDNVKYSGVIENRSSGGTYDTVNQNVHYSGTQTIKNVPGIAMSGPASGPCTGASGGLGIAGPGFGVGLNGAKVDDGCTVRENTRILGQLYQSLDAANPAKADAQAALMEGMMIIRNMNAAIGGGYAPKPAPEPKRAEVAPEPAKVVTQASTPIMMPAMNIAAVSEPTDPFVRSRMGLPKLASK